MATSALVLTAKGQAKLTAFVAAVRAGAAGAVGFAAVEVKAAVVAATPSPEEEGRLLSQGTSEGNLGGAGFGVGVFGTTEGGRFLREGGMMPLREAIERDPIQSSARGGLVTAGFGSPTRINAITGFSWMTRKRGVQGPTLPFNAAYVQALENGGVIWVVVPRPGTKALEPEPGKIARRMVKTLAPQRMFRGTLFLRSTRLKAVMSDYIRRTARAGNA